MLVQNTRESSQPGQWQSQKFAAGYTKYKKKLKLIHNIVDDKLHNKFIIAPFGYCCSCHRHFALSQHAVAAAERATIVQLNGANNNRWRPPSH